MQLQPVLAAAIFSLATIRCVRIIGCNVVKPRASSNIEMCTGCSRRAGNTAELLGCHWKSQFEFSGYHHRIVQYRMLGRLYGSRRGRRQDGPQEHHPAWQRDHGHRRSDTNCHIRRGSVDSRALDIWVGQRYVFELIVGTALHRDRADTGTTQE